MRYNDYTTVLLVFGASDSFTTMALYKCTYLLTYLNCELTDLMSYSVQTINHCRSVAQDLLSVIDHRLRKKLNTF